MVNLTGLGVVLLLMASAAALLLIVLFWLAVAFWRHRKGQRTPPPAGAISALLPNLALLIAVWADLDGPTQYRGLYARFEEWWLLTVAAWLLVLALAWLSGQRALRARDG